MRRIHRRSSLPHAAALPRGQAPNATYVRMTHDDVISHQKETAAFISWLFFLSCFDDVIMSHSDVVGFILAAVCVAGCGGSAHGTCSGRVE